MRTLAINVMYWADTWDAPQPPFFYKARDAGFEAVEISLINGVNFDMSEYKQALTDTGLKPFCIMGLNPATDITSPDESIRQAGIEYLKQALTATHRLGSPILCGLPYVPWMYFPHEADLQPYRDRCAAALSEVAVVAADNGVTLCLEVINRFETFMFNTVAEALAFLQMVDHPAVKLHLDTYHLNMEEDHIADAIRQTGPHLGHFHCVASNRKLPGQGHLDWPAIRQALDDIYYAGGLGIEVFPLPDTETGRSVNIWRPLVADLEADLRVAARFIHQQLID